MKERKMPLVILIPVALVGACCAVVTYIVLDRIWPPEPKAPDVDLTHKTSPSRSAVGRIGSSGSVRTYGE